MTIVRVKGVKRYRHPKTGIWYSYHRKTNTCLEPPHAFGSAEFFIALQAAESRLRASTAAPGTFGEMMFSYKSSPEFLQLKDRTRSDYHKVFNWLSGIESMPAVMIDSAFIAKLRNRAFRQKKRRFANYVRSVVSVIFAHSIEANLATSNPVKGTRQVRKATDAPIANRAWTAEEKKLVFNALSPQMIPPVAAARWAGLREGDIVKMPKTAYKNGALNLTTEKRGVPHWYPCPKPLRGILDAMPKNDTLRLFVNSRGKPWTAGGFSSNLYKVIAKLEKDGKVEPGLTLHGLRTSFAEEAADKGFTIRQIADGLAQRSTKSAEHYVRNIDRKKASNAISKSLDRTREVQNLSTRVSTLVFSNRRGVAKSLK